MNNPWTEGIEFGRLRIQERVLRALGSVASFFLPAVCASCARRLLPEEYGFCADCGQLVEVPAEPLCEYCGMPRPQGGASGRCQSCRHLPKDAFDAARAAFLYSGPLIDAIHHLKYHRYEELSECLGRWLFRYWRETWASACDVDMIVAVPLHPLRFWHRGFNQSESLAVVLSRLSRVPTAPAALRRVRHTATQTRKKPRERLETLSGAFAVPHPEIVCGKRILLVDDVMTTGATLSAAAQSLRSAGAVRIHALALARTPR